MNKEIIEQFAAELYQAQINRQAIAALTEKNSDFSVADAYAVQLLNVQKKLALGDKISGKKIGLTSLAMQEMLGVNESDYGHLFVSMDCPDGKIDTGELLQPKIEAELAFVLKEDLDKDDISAADVLAATDYIVAAFEIVDSRIANWQIKLADTVADNASSGAYVLGNIKVAPGSVDLKNCKMSLYKTVAGQEKLVNEGFGSAVLGDPVLAVAWLANKLRSYGVSLQAGEIVLSGAFSAAPAAQAGESYRAVFSDFGELQAEFI